MTSYANPLAQYQSHGEEILVSKRGLCRGSLKALLYVKLRTMPQAVHHN